MKRFSGEGTPKFSITQKNLNRLDPRQADLFESRIALIRELADNSMYGFDSDPQLDRLRKAYLNAAPQKLTSEDLSENCEPITLTSFFHPVSVIEKLEICRELIKKSRLFIDHTRLLRYTEGGGQYEAIDQNSKGRIAYMKNSFTESAFMKFSGIVANPRSAYLQSFDAVCEEVYSGECEFCILPIESSSEGRLNSFYSMIDRYELKIAAVCAVEQHDSQRFTKFALLKKSLTDSVHPSSKTADRIFEFKISCATTSNQSLTNINNSPICDIILSANACGMQILRIDSIPLPYNDEMIAYYISLGVDDSNLPAFLLYIMLEFPQYEPIGVYYNVK